MINIAILGMGTVGSGVYEGLIKNSKTIDKRVGNNIRIKKILDLRSFEGEEFESLVTNDFNEILNDKEISIVVEVMGGINPAYDFAKKLLGSGKSVITSNKELVASYGAELLSIAKEKNASFLFEASVGGGIPIIRTMNNSLTADNIEEIVGILNGTTNYILTQMYLENKEYKTALVEAQEKGYAEKDPTADVCGHDTCRKIAILLSLALGKQVDFEDVHTEGITKITSVDFAYVEKINSSIKLLAKAGVKDNKYYAWVAPTIVNAEHPLYIVNDVFNAVFVKGDIIDEIMLYGRGAGKLPTASAVIADVVECAKNIGNHINYIWSEEKIKLKSIDELDVERLIRIAYNDKEESKNSIESLFVKVEYIELESRPNEFAFRTELLKEKDISDKIHKLVKLKGISEIISSIRFY